jgi:hypothetical protein
LCRDRRVRHVTTRHNVTSPSQSHDRKRCLYERKELLKPEEERTWKIQEGMMKYGESGSSDEAGSGSGAEDETEDEEEEEEET